MNHLKGYSVSRKCYNFMTYADNFATGYFKKQGFTMHITMPKTSTHGYVLSIVVVVLAGPPTPLEACTCCCSNIVIVRSTGL